MLTEDGKHLYVSYDEYHSLIEKLALKVHQSGWEFDTILCLARGGLRPGDVLSRIFDKPLAIMSTSSYRAEAGTKQGALDIARFITTPKGEIAGKVLLVDDLADTGRSRRCGWFDAALLKRSAQVNGLSGLCITKLDVLDGIDVLQLCTGYMLDGELVDILPMGADDIARCVPVYEAIDGWTDSTVGVTDIDKLPENARRYLNRIEQVTGVPIAMVSTSPDRDHTIMMRHPYQAA